MNPLAELEPERAPECASDLVLDRYLASELSSDEEAAVAAHVRGCARCTARKRQRVMELEAWHAAPLAPRVAAAKRTPARRALLAAGGALAMAAAALLFVQPPVVESPDTTRTKGTRALGFYVKHGEKVRRGAQGEVVVPGDALRFLYTSEQPGYFAVLSVDGEKRASIYYPSASEAQPIAAGRDVPLPLSTVLDDVLGDEALYGVFCEQPIPLEPLRAALERDARAAPPAGCSFDRLSIHKAPR